MKLSETASSTTPTGTTASKPKRIHPTRNSARAYKRANAKLKFIGVDGEGDDSNPQQYVLLSVGDRSLHHDGAPLETLEIFSFLYDCFEQDRKRYPDNNIAYVGYFLGYDFNMWLKGISEDRARMLLEKPGIAKRRRKVSPVPFPVDIPSEDNMWAWEIDMLGTKRFRIRPGTGKERAVGNSNHNTWMQICDAGAFFQQSFVATLDTWGKGLVTEEEQEMIERNKLIRGGPFNEEMIAYNLLENELLARIMTTLSNHFERIGVKLDKGSWFGPGQAAQTWMDTTFLPTNKQLTEVNPIPKPILEAARATYYGGWFEIFKHGYVEGPCYEYDVNSAYPSVISTLPCLMHGAWEQGKGVPPDSKPTLRMLYVRASSSNVHIGPLPYRGPDKSIMRPLQTQGWYWEHEINAAISAGLLDPDTLMVAEWCDYYGCDCPSPFAEVTELYKERQKAKSVGDDYEKALKLVYNSIYGKCAQSLGHPKFSNPVWASLITAGCRVQILSAIRSYPGPLSEVVMVATDGIYFANPHPSLPISDALGEWSAETHMNMTLFMPGLYWSDKARNAIAEGKSAKFKTRGVPRIALAQELERIDAEFRACKSLEEVAEVTATLTIGFAQVSAKQALTRNDWSLCGRVDSTTSRTISADMRKKRLVVDGQSVVPIIPSDWAEESLAYDGSFGDERLELALLGEALTPDGDAYALIAGMLK